MTKHQASLNGLVDTVGKEGVGQVEKVALTFIHYHG